MTRRFIHMARIIRGTAVVVKAGNFSSDPSVGIEMGPDEIYAETPEGQPFEMTEDEEAHYGGEATDLYMQELSDYFRTQANERD